MFQKNIFYSLLTITPLVTTSFIFCSNFNYDSKFNFNNSLNFSEQTFNGEVIKEDFSINQTLPSKLDPRESLPYKAKVKHQGNSPLCGAYSLSSAMEWNLIKNNIDAQNVATNLDYSINPKHVWFTYSNRTSEYDKLNLTYNDINNDVKVNLTGIFPERLSTKLSQWVGPVYNKYLSKGGLENIFSMSRTCL